MIAEPTAGLPWHHTASVFVINRAHTEPELLLLWHEKLRHWMIPGGHVEPGETEWQAAVREVQEETGLTVALTDLTGAPQARSFHDVELVPAPAWIAVEDIPDPDGVVRHRHVDHLYVSILPDAGDDCSLRGSCEWWRLDQLPRQQMFPGTGALADILAAAIGCSTGATR